MKTDFKIQTKIWIESQDGQIAFGLGRYHVLEAIDRVGSMHAAAKELKMGYRALWLRVQSSEDLLGKPLVTRTKHGSTLTPFAKNLMKKFKRTRSIIQTEANDVYNDLFNEDLN
ncbi:MAG: LysR family transcriptional regulator [Desulfobacterales bacterium]|nr:LysR family transcriptional regulator [Desulfobacterales bacterium]